MDNASPSDISTCRRVGENVREDCAQRSGASLELSTKEPWKQGQHQLVVQTTIEDLAGNNIGKPFDVDLFEGVQRRLTTSTVKVSLPIQ